RRAPLRPLPLRDVLAPPRNAGRAPAARAGRGDPCARARRHDRAVRLRWFGATGTRVPEIAVEGDPAIPITPDTLVVDDVSDVHSLHAAPVEGRPVVVRASTADAVLRALGRPEVASVLVPDSARELLDLDLVKLTYG